MVWAWRLGTKERCRASHGFGRWIVFMSSKIFYKGIHCNDEIKDRPSINAMFRFITSHLSSRCQGRRSHSNTQRCLQEGGYKRITRSKPPMRRGPSHYSLSHSSSNNKRVCHTQGLNAFSFCNRRSFFSRYDVCNRLYVSSFLAKGHSAITYGVYNKRSK